MSMRIFLHDLIQRTRAIPRPAAAPNRAVDALFQQHLEGARLAIDAVGLAEEAVHEAITTWPTLDIEDGEAFATALRQTLDASRGAVVALLKQEREVERLGDYPDDIAVTGSDLEVVDEVMEMANFGDEAGVLLAGWPVPSDRELLADRVLGTAEEVVAQRHAWHQGSTRALPADALAPDGGLAQFQLTAGGLDDEAGSLAEALQGLDGEAVRIACDRVQALLHQSALLCAQIPGQVESLLNAYRDEQQFGALWSTADQRRTSEPAMRTAPRSVALLMVLAHAESVVETVNAMLSATAPAGPELVSWPASRATSLKAAAFRLCAAPYQQHADSASARGSSG